MDKKKLFLIVGGAIAVVVAVIVALSFIGKEPAEPSGGAQGASIDRDLSDEEKAAIKASTQEFLLSLGNYGWYPDLIKNPQVASSELTDEYFYTQEHSTVEDAQNALRALTNTTAYDVRISGDQYGTPFSVESQFLEDVVVPNRPIAEGNQTFVVVTVPVRSTLSYISSSIGYFEEDGTEVPSKTTVQIRNFEGELELKFEKSSGKWFVGEFATTVGVFATDSFFIANGDLILNSPVEPVSSEEYAAD